MPIDRKSGCIPVSFLKESVNLLHELTTSSILLKVWYALSFCHLVGFFKNAASIFLYAPPPCHVLIHTCPSRFSSQDGSPSLKRTTDAVQKYRKKERLYRERHSTSPGYDASPACFLPPKNNFYIRLFFTQKLINVFQIAVVMPIRRNKHDTILLPWQYK